MILLSIDNKSKYFDAKIIEIIGVAAAVATGHQEHLHKG
jgi:hypothetical protein